VTDGDDEAALSMLVNMLTEQEMAALTEVNLLTTGHAMVHIP
jgi:hypothetical protein